MFREPRTTCVVTTHLVANTNAYKLYKINVEQTGFTASFLRRNHFTVYAMGRGFKF